VVRVADKHPEDLAPLAIRAQLRWDVVRPIVEDLAPGRTIEIGVGQGAVGVRLCRLSTISYVGFELDNVSFEKAKARIEPLGGHVFKQHVESIAPAPADLLCAFEVLEHIENDHEALTQWASYVVPGGHIVLSVPAHQRRFGPMDIHAGHYRRYSPEGLEGLAESVGLVKPRAVLYGAPLGYALEAVRNRIDRRKLVKLEQVDAVSLEALTAASGRTFQFDGPSWKSSLASFGTTPFRYLQRVWPGGVGLVLVAEKPATKAKAPTQPV
jgi:SAM-dependent methyltransferase